jgi:hypothetical protein
MEISHMRQIHEQKVTLSSHEMLHESDFIVTVSSIHDLDKRSN